MFLVDNSLNNRVQIATQLQKPIYLKDKKFLRIFIQKQVMNINIHLIIFFKLFFDKSIDKCENSGKNSFILCLIEAAVHECGCVPLTTVLWAIQDDLQR